VGVACCVGFADWFSLLILLFIPFHRILFFLRNELLLFFLIVVVAKAMKKRA
jgi:hypothetical protein